MLSLVARFSSRNQFDRSVSVPGNVIPYGLQPHQKSIKPDRGEAVSRTCAERCAAASQRTDVVIARPTDR